MGSSMPIILVPFLVFASIFTFQYIKYTYSEKSCIRRVSIKSVGGCDAFGNCGVSYDDGTQGKLRYPAKDQDVCLEYKSFKFQWGHIRER